MMDTFDYYRTRLEDASFEHGANDVVLLHQAIGILEDLYDEAVADIRTEQELASELVWGQDW